MAFHVGQKVVCVDAQRPSDFDGSNTGLVDQAIYTIDGIITLAASVGFYLVELRHPNGRGFTSDRFRPVVERKTDIAIFQAMLTPKPKKARRRERA